MATQIKQCVKCKEIKDASCFYKEKRVHDGLTARCKDCMKADANQSYVSRKDEVLERMKSHYNARRNKDIGLQRKYGMTIEQWEEMFKEQGMCCAICKNQESRHGSGSFVVDHCHSELYVRGILCGPCNAMIGLAKDSTETLKAAIVYLEKKRNVPSIAENKEKLGLIYNDTTLLQEAQREDLQVVREWKADGLSLRGIADRLKSLKVRPPANFGKWTAKTVERLIEKQHFYLGLATKKEE